jgi:hypothetical protein
LVLWVAHILAIVEELKGKGDTLSKIHIGLQAKGVFLLRYQLREM